MGREISLMINAWSLAASILDGTFDEDYPIMKKKEIEHSDYYYDYKRNDPNAENPFTDPVDRARAERVVGNIGYDDIEVYPCREDIPEKYWGKPIIKSNNFIIRAFVQSFQRALMVLHNVRQSVLIA